MTYLAGSKSGRLWSLLDMLARLHFLTFFRTALAEAKQKLVAVPDNEWDMNPGAVNAFGDIYRDWLKGFRDHDFVTSVACCEHLIANLPNITKAGLQTRMDQLEECFAYDARDRSAEVIPADKRVFYNATLAICDAKFPSAGPEITEGLTCYALGRNTACVFHLMRAVEYGLRVLVAAVGVTSPALPLEYHEWNSLIEQFDSRVDAAEIHKWGRPASVNALAFFSRLSADCHAFKDEVRNVLMHTRSGGTYDAPRAHSVINRVIDFYNRMGTRVDEVNPKNILDRSLFMSP